MADLAFSLLKTVRKFQRDPGACSHTKILKSTIFEMPFLAFWGMELYRIPKVVTYMEDMIFSWIIFKDKRMGKGHI